MHEIVSILDSILGQHKKYANTEHYYQCPFCNHHNPKLAVNVRKRKWHCWTCHQSGSTIMSLMRKLHASETDIIEVCRCLDEYIPPQVQIEIQKRLSLPTEYIPLWESNPRATHKKALQYVLNRGLTHDDILRYQLGYCMDGRYANRIIIPSFDDTSTLNYFVARDFSGTGHLKYSNPPVSKNVIIFDNHINWNYPIVITEGMFDAMAIKRNAIPILGTYIPKKLREKIIQYQGNKIYLALDNDALKKTLDMAEKFMNEGFIVYVINMTDKDPSVIGFATMQKLIHDATPFTFQDLIQFRLSLVK